MKKWIMKTLILLSAITLFTACSTKETIQLSCNVPSAIFIEDKVYWEAKEEVEYISNLEEVGEIKAVSKGNIPTENLTVNEAAKDYVGDKVYSDQNTYYVYHDDKYYSFIYVNKSEVGNREDWKEPEVVEGEIPAPTGYRPRFVYNDCMYLLGDLATQEDLKYFEKVGEIKAVYKDSAENFDGSGNVGDELFASDIQNGFMILHDIKDDSYRFYENMGYINRFVYRYIDE